MEKEEAFQTLKQKLYSAPILAFPEGTENFVVYYDASFKGFGAVLMQREKTEAMKEENVKAENLGRLLKPIFEIHSNGIQYFKGRLWLPLFGGIRDMIMHESQKSKYSIHRVAQNQQGYNAWQNGRIQGAKNAGQNAGVYSGGNQNGLVVVPGIANQNGTGNVVAARAKGDLDEIEEVNANCILMANFQHASTFGTQLDKAPVYDTDDSAE
nr:putative reverse transcriptase domain-containing protein [Tanacetum cinerariifolium]